MTGSQKTVLVIGGTGAQGAPIVKALTHDGHYAVRVITRNTETPEAKALAALPNATLFKGQTYDEIDLQKAFEGVHMAYVNTNGFAIGEKAEIYWGIRSYEIARQHGLEHFVWANVPWGSKAGNYDPKYRCGHLDGKNKVTDFISAQPTFPMAWSVLSSCPYIEMLSESWSPTKDESGTYIFNVPLGSGSAPMIDLDDLGSYARWIFDNPYKSIGFNLEVATCQVSLAGLVEAFTKVTGKTAKGEYLSIDEYLSKRARAGFDPEVKLAHSGDPKDPTVQTFRQNFSGFYNVFRDNLSTRDYKFLDKILPTRVKTLEEWMRKSDYTGDFKLVLVDAGRGAFAKPKT